MKVDYKELKGCKTKGNLADDNDFLEVAVLFVTDEKNPEDQRAEISKISNKVMGFDTSENINSKIIADFKDNINEMKLKINEVRADYNELTKYLPKGNFNDDRDFFDAADKFIQDINNPVKERAEIVKKYDKAMGYEPSDNYDNDVTTVADYIKNVNEEKLDQRMDEAMESTKFSMPRIIMNESYEMSESVNTKDLSPGDKFSIEHKKWGKINVVVTKVVGDMIYWKDPLRNIMGGVKGDSKLVSKDLAKGRPSITIKESNDTDYIITQMDNYLKGLSKSSDFDDTEISNIKADHDKIKIELTGLVDPTEDDIKTAFSKAMGDEWEEIYHEVMTYESKMNESYAHDKLFMNWWNDTYKDNEHFIWDKKTKELVVFSEKGDELEKMTYADLQGKIQGFPDDPNEVYFLGESKRIDNGTILGFVRISKKMNEGFYHEDSEINELADRLAYILANNDGKFKKERDELIQKIETKLGEGSAKDIVNAIAKEEFATGAWDDKFSDEDELKNFFLQNLTESEITETTVGELGEEIKNIFKKLILDYSATELENIDELVGEIILDKETGAINVDSIKKIATELKMDTDDTTNFIDFLSDEYKENTNELKIDVPDVDDMAYRLSQQTGVASDALIYSLENKDIEELIKITGKTEEEVYEICPELKKVNETDDFEEINKTNFKRIGYMLKDHKGSWDTTEMNDEAKASGGGEWVELDIGSDDDAMAIVDDKDAQTKLKEEEGLAQFLAFGVPYWDATNRDFVVIMDEEEKVAVYWAGGEGMEDAYQLLEQQFVGEEKFTFSNAISGGSMDVNLKDKEAAAAYLEKIGSHRWKLVEANETLITDSQYIVKKIGDMVEDERVNGNIEYSSLLSLIGSRLNQSFPQGDITVDDMNDILTEPNSINYLNKIDFSKEDIIDSIMNESKVNEEIYKDATSLWEIDNADKAVSDLENYLKGAYPQTNTNDIREHIDMIMFERETKKVIPDSDGIFEIAKILGITDKELAAELTEEYFNDLEFVISESKDSDKICPDCKKPLNFDGMDVLRCYNKKCDKYGLTADVAQPIDKTNEDSSDDISIFVKIIDSAGIWNELYTINPDFDKEKAESNEDKERIAKMFFDAGGSIEELKEILTTQNIEYSINEGFEQIAHISDLSNPAAITKVVMDLIAFNYNASDFILGEIANDASFLAFDLDTGEIDTNDAFETIAELLGADETTLATELSDAINNANILESKKNDDDDEVEVEADDEVENEEGEKFTIESIDRKNITMKNTDGKSITITKEKFKNLKIIRKTKG